MAVRGPFRVEHDEVFPKGCTLHSVLGKKDYQRSTKDEEVPAIDKETHKRIWVVTVIDDDEENRNPAVKVNVPADHQPVIAKGSPVEFGGLRVMPYLEKRGENKILAFSLRADAVHAPSAANGKAAARKEAA